MNSNPLISSRIYSSYINDPLLDMQDLQYSLDITLSIKIIRIPTKSQKRYWVVKISKIMKEDF